MKTGLSGENSGPTQLNCSLFWTGTVMYELWIVKELEGEGVVLFKISADVPFIFIDVIIKISADKLIIFIFVQ